MATVSSLERVGYLQITEQIRRRFAGESKVSDAWDVEIDWDTKNAAHAPKILMSSSPVSYQGQLYALENSW